MKPKVFVSRVIPDVGLKRIKDHCDAEIWSDPLPPPYAVLRQKVAGCDGLVALLTDKIDAALMDAASRLKVVSNFAKSIPDMKFDIKEVLISGNRVIVRGEVSGTPSGVLFGVPYTGKSFRILAIDIQTVKDDRIVQTYHMENWVSAMGQLRAK